MSIKRNAIIMAAGTSSRFVPLSLEKPKGLLEVNGEILIERQIRQLIDAGITDITIVTGYKAELFEYLKDKFDVHLVHNEDYARYNNISSLIRVSDQLSNTFICSSDNYFPQNVFADNPVESYYSALYADGNTSEYCLTMDTNDNITGVNVGGKDAWYMVGHVFFSDAFSNKFSKLMVVEYTNEKVRNGYWEDLYIQHIKSLPPMKVRRYESHQIKEFDTLDELRAFDSTYIENTRSSIIKDIANRLDCNECDLSDFKKKIADNCSQNSLQFSFSKGMDKYLFSMEDNSLKRI